MSEIIELENDCEYCKYYAPNEFFIGEGFCFFDSENPGRVNTFKKDELRKTLMIGYEEAFGKNIIAISEKQQMCDFFELKEG